MEDVIRAGFVAHSESAAFRLAFARTIALIDRYLDDHSYVSFSAGKDSAVCADICHRRRPGIPILMVDPGCPTHWTEADRAMWLGWAKQRGWNLTLFPFDKWRVPQHVEVEEYRRQVHDDMFRALHDHAKANGLTQRVMGMRAEESPRRAMLSATRGPAYAYADGGLALNPIMHWTAADVWAYTLRVGLPWLSIYDHMGPYARNGLIGRSGARQGRLAWLKIHYPDAYMEALRLVPEATAYV